ncbi:MAG: PEP-CTERM sorting domain-containing protein [Nitrosospira sp.]|nr:PEP-CTERM sorting domain-containing protein [Nitrosospira sp.]
MGRVLAPPYKSSDCGRSVCYFFNRPRTPFIFENFKNRGRRNVKIIPGFNLRWFLLAAAFLAGLGGLGFGSHASAQYVDQAYLIDLNSRTATKLGAFSGYSGHASGINDAGQVVGSSTTATGQSHAFITGPNGAGMRDLGTLGGDSSYAVAINASGQVAGVSATSTGTHAFITGPDGVGMRDLGTLAGTDWSGSEAHAINEAGQVAGESDGHAFITGSNGAGMIDLNLLADLPKGVILVNPIAINNAGQVIAYGYITVVPEPESYALLLAGLALLAALVHRKKGASLLPAPS